MACSAPLGFSELATDRQRIAGRKDVGQSPAHFCEMLVVVMMMGGCRGRS
jgi:hypothetical protein